MAALEGPAHEFGNVYVFMHHTTMMPQCIGLRNQGGNNSAMHRYSTIQREDPRTIIERLRVARGYPSIRALAIAAGVGQPSLSRYMTGESKDMEVATLRALAACLDVTIGQLLGEVTLPDDPGMATVIRAMESLPKPQREALAAAAAAMLKVTKSE